MNKNGNKGPMVTKMSTLEGAKLNNNNSTKQRPSKKKRKRKRERERERGRVTPGNTITKLCVWRRERDCVCVMSSLLDERMHLHCLLDRIQSFYLHFFLLIFPFIHFLFICLLLHCMFVSICTLSVRKTYPLFVSITFWMVL